MVRAVIEDVSSWTVTARASIDGGVSVTAHDGDDVVLRADLSQSHGDLRLQVDDPARGDRGCDASDAARVLVLVGHRLADGGTERLVLDAREPIFRSQARRLGFSGGLRQPLTRSPWTRSGTAARSSESTEPSEPASAHDSIAVRLTEHLPSVSVSGLPVSRRARVAKRAASGVAAPVELEVHGPDGVPLRLLVGDRPDLMVEPVAEAIDTALRFRRSIGPLATHIRRIDFAVPDHLIRTGRYGGVPQTGTGAAVVSADLVSWEGLAMFRRRAVPERAADTVLVPPPWSVVDRLIAHLCGRLVDHGLLADDRHRHTEVRRRLGKHLGVATFEHAIHRRRGDDPEVQQLAHLRLATEVSAFAATDVDGAIGELFTLWWFRPAEPAPLVTCFAEVVDDLYR